jgi:hypothetical protein
VVRRFVCRIGLENERHGQSSGDLSVRRLLPTTEGRIAPGARGRKRPARSSCHAMVGFAPEQAGRYWGLEL